MSRLMDYSGQVRRSAQPSRQLLSCQACTLLFY